MESAGVEGSIAHWLQHDLRADAQVFAIFSNMLNCFSNILKRKFFLPELFVCGRADSFKNKILHKVPVMLEYIEKK